MIVKKLYYGRREISSIILNGKTIWASSRSEYVSLSYDVHLTVAAEEEVALVEVVLKEILSGDVEWAVEQDVDTNGTVVTLDMINHNVIGNCRIEVEFAHVNMLPAAMGNSNTKNIIDTKGSEIGMSLEAAVSSCAEPEILYLNTNKNGSAAIARQGAHSFDQHCRTASTRTVLIVKATSGGYTSDIEVAVRRFLHGSVASAVSSPHNNAVHVVASYRNSGVVGSSKDTHHLLDVTVIETDILSGTIGSAIQTSHASNFEITETEKYYISGSNITAFNKNSQLHIDEHDYVHGMIADMTSGDKSSTLTLVSVVDGGADVVGSVRDNHLPTVIAVDEIEGKYEPILVSTTLHDASGLHTDTNANVDEISVVEGLTDMSVEFNEDANRLCESLSNVSFSHRCTTTIDEKESLLAHTGRCICAGCVLKHSYYTETNAYLDKICMDDNPDYIYPTPTGTNLYIKQIYAVVPNGTNLNFSRDAAE